MGMDMSNYKMIYKKQVFNVVSVFLTFDSMEQDTAIRKPKFIDANVIDEDGELKTIHDEAWMFKFVRR